jgi:signal transduction histidine kinase
MNGRSGSSVSIESCFRSGLAAAQRRLAGRWDDLSAWRVVCEELAAAWAAYPGVKWVLVQSRDAMAPIAESAERTSAAGLIRIADCEHAPWRDGRIEEEFWRRLSTAHDALISGQGPFPGANGGDLESDHWLACGLRGLNGPVMVFILGYTPPEVRDSTACPDWAEYLTLELTAARAFMEPMLGMQRRMASLDAAARTSRSECEALSRLGEMRSRLAAVTAHELKTPLTSITAYAEVLEKRAGDPAFPHTTEFLRVIRGEADRLLRLVDRLLDSSRRGRGPDLVEPQPIDVGPIYDDVRRVMAPQAVTRNIRLEVHTPRELPRLDGDADLVRQALLNLLNNALKFTPSGGRVTLSAREEASTVRLTVSDSGPGIAPNELRAIFQSFYRTRAASRTEGVGLGLSIVKEIVILHGGHLDVHSRLGRGSTFGMHLPKAQQICVVDTAPAASGVDISLLKSMVGHTQRLVAELTAARAVVVMLPSIERGMMVAAATSGFDADIGGTLTAAGGGIMQRAMRQSILAHGGTSLPEPWAGFVDQPGAVMLTPLRMGDPNATGIIMAARRQGGGVFDTDDLLLLRVLTEILSKAWSAALAPGASRTNREMVTDALAALTGLRRSGIPTADPLALRILSRTGRRLGQSTFEIRLLQYACALHDAGMLLVDPDVLSKPEELDIDERGHIGDHPQRGLDLLGPLVEVPDLQSVIRYHHERVDGKGYPEGRRGADIPLGSRILAVIDAFFAMIRSRPWREGMPMADAVSEIQRHAGSQFDEDVVSAFLSTLLEEGLLSSERLRRTVGDTARR